ncbi:hypothetical protein ACWGJW_02560 [Streptomyces nigrescens]
MLKGERIVVVVTNHFDTLELYGATGVVLEGPNGWGDYGVLLDPEFDPHQLPAAFKAHELEAIGTPCAQAGS